MASMPPFIPAWDPEAESRACCISSEQVGHVEEYMAGHISVDECAVLLTKPVQAAASRDAQTMEDAVYAIHAFINSSARTNLHYQPQMLLLIKAIQKLPLVEVPTPKLDEDGEAISLGDENQKVWEDMSGFGHFWGDMLRARHADFYDNYNSTDTNKAAAASAEWADAIAWSMRLVSLHDPRVASDFFLEYTSYPIQHVLEVEEHPMFAQELPAAAMAFSYAAPELLHLCRERHQTDVKYALYGMDKASVPEGRSYKFLWIGPGGYSPERWDFWKSRWQTLSTASAPGDKIQKLASAAVSAMEGAERALPNGQ
ncbi:hypothetical protein F4821DRAFT_234377 [Hypoxylon rubiginosum]|uniref:Uncharacterized protein n=1 Tax=Hypoxylon rubiginosum TaxID=110542 RepID=A0ACC0D717_9PEZI|nr:hypothetical protein F4821DRAFT_234377 [Hypoxylon rubiginosum]